jgi:Dolichyl-phosphate-mannose-protein mannosyltransferase
MMPFSVSVPAAGTPHRRWVVIGVPLGFSALALLTLMTTDPAFGMVWDEGYTVRRDRLLDQWVHRACASARSGQWRLAFEKRELDHYWLFSREEPNGHPPFYALLGLAGWWLSHRWLPPLEAYRFGPMLLTAVTVGVIYNHLARRRGFLAGAVAAVLLVAMPRSFAHTHYAHYDMPMTCLWLLAQVAFVASLNRRVWAIPLGVALGLSAGTKFTGLFAVVPAAAWVTLVEVFPRIARRGDHQRGEPQSSRPGLGALSIALPLAVLTLYAIQPPWWVEPVAGPFRYFASNLTRATTQPLATLYLGNIYEFSLPWHNTLVLTAITTPVLVLVLSMIGIAGCLSRARVESWALIWPLCWLTLMIVRALPNAPGHDGIRLFLPSVATLAILGGLGAAWLAERLQIGWRRAVAPLLAAAAVGECLFGIARTYPYTDSYYSVAIGGLQGVERSGFELTYYWETAGPEFLNWARAEARRKPITLAFPMDATNHKLLREWGEIPPEVRIVDLNEPPPGKPIRSDYFVLQRRRGLYYPSDRWLDQYGHPVFAIRREGVDLLRVFTVEEDQEAADRTKNQRIPRYLRRSSGSSM